MPDLARLAPPRPASPQANPIPYLALRPTSYIYNEVGEEVGAWQTNQNNRALAHPQRSPDAPPPPRHTRPHPKEEGMSRRTGYRCRNDWGGGDLPGPYAEGDIIDVPEGAKALERMYGMPPGRYKVVYGPSIDEGDAWYYRLAPSFKAPKSSDRLHVAFAARCDPHYWSEDVDWLEGCTLVRTADPEGLAEREAMIAAGWKPPHHEYCPTCKQEIFPKATTP